MKTKKHYVCTVGTFPKFNKQSRKKGKIDNPNTRIHDRSISGLCTGTSISSDRVKLYLLVYLSNMLYQNSRRKYCHCVYSVTSKISNTCSLIGIAI